MFMGDGDGTPIDAWYMNLGASGNFAVATGQAGVVSVSGGIAYTANKWLHCGGVWAANNSRIAYLDGVASTEETTSRDVSAQRTWIGHYQDSTTHFYFNGEICECAIWDVALSPGEMRQLSRPGTTADQIRPGSLVAYWFPIAHPEMGNGASPNYALGSPQTGFMRPMTANSYRMAPHVPFTVKRPQPVRFPPTLFPSGGGGGVGGHLIGGHLIGGRLVA